MNSPYRTPAESAKQDICHVELWSNRGRLVTAMIAPTEHDGITYTARQEAERWVEQCYRDGNCYVKDIYYSLHDIVMFKLKTQE